MPKRITPEEYRVIFANNYPDYELLSDYSGDKNYITVRCKLDGNVWRTKPNWLKHGVGCQICYNRRRGEKTRKGNDAFIKQAKEIHGDKYDYSKVNYINSKTHVIVTCPKHGDFYVTPNKHLMGRGCPKCADELNGLNKRISQEEFVKRCALIHNNKYDYSKVDYQGWDKPITIICPKHGEFVQIAGTHLSGCGCPYCNQSHLEKETEKLLVDNNIKFEYQKRFSWLGKQSLDFYLPEYNIGIECQGIQHYSNYYFNWGKNSSLNAIIERDVLKNKLCSDNNVTLYYISKSKKILTVSDIYNVNNTCFTFAELINKIKHVGLFEDIVNEIMLEII